MFWYRADIRQQGEHSVYQLPFFYLHPWFLFLSFEAVGLWVADERAFFVVMLEAGVVVLDESVVAAALEGVVFGQQR